jgi:hypothetical protein
MLAGVDLLEMDPGKECRIHKQQRHRQRGGVRE